jgi:hypothetical protein
MKYSDIKVGDKFSYTYEIDGISKTIPIEVTEVRTTKKGRIRINGTGVGEWDHSAVSPNKEVYFNPA